MTECPLCHPADETLLWQDEVCRLIRVGDADYPAYLRVIWKAHKREMSDIEPAAQRHLLHVVLAAEATLRTLLQPHKINLASFGNVVPHLHWHLIPRYLDDRHFPQPVWGVAQRKGGMSPAPEVDDARLALAVRNAIAEHIAG